MIIMCRSTPCVIRKDVMCLVPGESPGDPLHHAAALAVLAADGAAHGAGRRAGLPRYDSGHGVASTPASDVVDLGGVVAHALLALELLVKGEDGALRGCGCLAGG